MSQSTMGQVVDAENADTTWKLLYRIGAVVPWITLASYLTELAVIIPGETYPTTMEDWFSLLQRNKIMGLLYLNALDTFSIALLGLMFLALYIALRRANPSLATIAAFFAFVGIAVLVATRAMMVSRLLNLTGQYTAAATEIERSQLLIAGEAIASPARATPQTTGFFFLAVAALIISLVDRRGDERLLRFHRRTFSQRFVHILHLDFDPLDEVTHQLRQPLAAICQAAVRHCFYVQR